MIKTGNDRREGCVRSIERTKGPADVQIGRIKKLEMNSTLRTVCRRQARSIVTGFRIRKAYREDGKTLSLAKGDDVKFQTREPENEINLMLRRF